MQGDLSAVVCYECSELNSAAVAADDYFLSDFVSIVLLFIFNNDCNIFYLLMLPLIVEQSPSIMLHLTLPLIVPTLPLTV